MSVLAVIPSRYGAQRFPGKPLALLWGRPMLRHVWERARLAHGVDRLVIATDDERIAAAARGWGAEVEMTSPDCASGTDRVAEVARTLPEFDIVFNTGFRWSNNAKSNTYDVQTLALHESGHAVGLGHVRPGP